MSTPSIHPTFSASPSSFLAVSNVGVFLIEKMAVFTMSDTRKIVSLLTSRVGQVIFNGAKKKVVGPYAWRVVAAMKNLKPGFNWTMRNLPRCSVRIFLFIENMINAVPKRVFAAGPLPTSVGLSNLAPKSFNELFASEFKVFAHMWSDISKNIALKSINISIGDKNGKSSVNSRLA